MAQLPSRPPASEAVLKELTGGLIEPGEEIINTWTSMAPTVLLVLTNRKILGFRVKGVFNKTYSKELSRNLETLPEPHAMDGSPRGFGLLLLAGQKFQFLRTDAESICAEISHARVLRVTQLDGGRGVAPLAGVNRAEREVITREVIKIRCRFCGQLNDQGSPKCVQCGAPS